MFPILFKFPEFIPFIGGKALHAYGLMVALGFLAGMQWVKYESKRVGLDVNKMLDLFFYIILFSIIGARLLYVLISVPFWWKDPLILFRFWEGGLVFYGGFIAAVITSLIYSRYHHIPFLKIADVYVPGIAVGHAIGRLGCFAAGCCYGKPIDPNHFLAIVYPENQASIGPHQAVYAVQLMESAAIFLLFGGLILFRKYKKFDGEVFLVYLTIYPILRGVLEIFRGDKIRGFIIPDILSTSQFISLIWVVIAGVLWIVLLKKRTGSPLSLKGRQ